MGSLRLGVSLSFLIVLVSLLGAVAAGTAMAAAGEARVTSEVTAAGQATATGQATAAITPVCGQPQLGFSQIRAYWPSYADYISGNLSVDDRITNHGPGEAQNVYVMGTVNTNGVTATNIPINVGNIAGYGIAELTVQYSLPQALLAGGSFRSTVYVFAGDGCGNYFSYPGPLPGDCT
ncbi:MAG: hypothetical protein M1539_01120 [Actinobacteria bacterium]|nr:hypothetical protein [Actinomycetota bacterium]MCL5882579.1 hypothetical protein [Actinomycetota bacterium]